MCVTGLPCVVSNVPKILKWEQITTKNFTAKAGECCFQCSKDTKMRANHNFRINKWKTWKVVSNVPKILKWEQITTIACPFMGYSSCFQCSKDTKMRANHNNTIQIIVDLVVVSNVPKILKWEQITTLLQSWLSRNLLFPMFQRY